MFLIHNSMSFMLVLPLLGAITLGFFGAQSKWVALGVGAGASALGLFLIWVLYSQGGDQPIVQSLDWVSAYSINYELLLNGMNVMPFLLVCVLFPVLIASEWEEGRAGLHALLLVLQSSLLGAICSNDLFVQFFFWVLSSNPFFFLLGVWSGQDKERVSIQYIVCSSLSAALLFAALIVIYASSDPHSFSYTELSSGEKFNHVIEVAGLSLNSLSLAFGLVSLSFAFRLPVWPIHGWFMHLIKEAPSSVLVAMVGGVVPVGMSIYFRMGYRLFPEMIQEFATILAVFGCLNLVAGALGAFSQKCIKWVLGYLSLAWVGQVLLGMSALNMSAALGAAVSQFTSGVSLAALALCAGWLSTNEGTLEFASDQGEGQMGGKIRSSPVFAALFGISLASVLGVPGTVGFVGVSLLTLGGALFSTVGAGFVGLSWLILTFTLFRMFRFIFLGTPKSSKNQGDLNRVEKLYLVPLLLITVFFGFYPKPILDLVRPVILQLGFLSK